MGFIGQVLLNGLTVGCIYALVAIGLSLTFSVMRLVNFAHGELYMVGAFSAFVIGSNILKNYWVIMIVVALIGGVLGFVIERVVFRPTYSKPLGTQLVVAFGLSVILQEGMVQISGGLPHKLFNPYPTVRNIGSVAIMDQRLAVVGVTVVLLIAVFFFFRRTRLGKGMRAAANNRLAAGLVGISVNRMASYAFIMGASLAGIAAVLLAPMVVIEPFMGANLTVIAFVAIVLGGMGSIGGAILGGFLIGIVENLIAAYFSTQWALSIVFVLFMLLLRFKPTGLFGKE